MEREARIEILKGNNEGARFRVTGQRVVFGRAANSDIVITDPSASRAHAELIKMADGYVIRDLNSSNGIYVNGTKVSEYALRSGDIFSIGDHQYKYSVAESAPKEMPSPQKAAAGAIPGLDKPSAPPSVPGAAGGNPNKKRMIIYGGAGVFLLLFLLLAGSEDEETPKPKAGINKTQEEEMSFYEKLANEEISYSRKIEPGMEDFYNKANEHYFAGRREFRVKNYVRAMDEFMKALTFYPKHGQSRYYAKRTSRLMKEESRKHIELGMKFMSQFRYDVAIKHFKEAMSLNVRDPNSKIYKKAEAMIKKAEKNRKTLFK